MPIPPRAVPKQFTRTNHETPYIFIEVKSSSSEDDIHHERITLSEVRALLKTLKKSAYNHLHELICPNHVRLIGYSAIQDYCNGNTYKTKEDHIINPVLQEPVKTGFIREVDILRLVTEIQTLATKPGNENKIHELSTVLKYVMSPESVPEKKEQKRQAVLYTVKFMNGLWYHDIEVLACNQDEALNMFRALNLPYTDIVSIQKKK